MSRKINFLVALALFILFILIANAEEKIHDNSTNETLNLNSQNIEFNEIKADVNSVEQVDIPNNESIGKSVKASFGVYLQIVG